MISPWLSQRTHSLPIRVDCPVHTLYNSSSSGIPLGVDEEVEPVQTTTLETSKGPSLPLSQEPEVISPPASDRGSPVPVLPSGDDHPPTVCEETEMRASIRRGLEPLGNSVGGCAEAQLAYPIPARNPPMGSETLSAWPSAAAETPVEDEDTEAESAVPAATETMVAEGGEAKNIVTTAAETPVEDEDTEAESAVPAATETMVAEGVEADSVIPSTPPRQDSPPVTDDINARTTLSTVPIWGPLSRGEANELLKAKPSGSFLVRNPILFRMTRE